MSVEHGPSHESAANAVSHANTGHDGGHAKHKEYRFATFPTHQGAVENFADKKIKWGASLAIAAIGALTFSHPVVGLGLLTYAAGDMLADYIAKIKNRSKEGMFPEHKGQFEQAMDKGVKKVGMGVTLWGVLAASHPLAGAGLIAYAAGDMAADFAAKVRRGNTEALAKPNEHH